MIRKPFVSYPKASGIASGVFFLVLALIAYLENWWPGIMLAIGAFLFVRQVLVNKVYDGILSAIIFGGIFITVQYHLSWIPVLFVIAGIYLIFRAFIQGGPEDEEEEEEEIQEELEEDAGEK